MVSFRSAATSQEIRFVMRHYLRNEDSFRERFTFKSLSVRLSPQPKSTMSPTMVF